MGDKTFWARGAGGAVFEFDALAPGTNRAEILAGQIAKGELTVLTGEPREGEVPDEMRAADVQAFLAAAAAPPIEVRTRAGRADAPAGDTAADNEPAAVPAPAGIFDGNVDAVLDFVHGGDGDDPEDGWQDRARAALAAEQAKDKPRVSLVAKLEDALASDDSTPAEVVPDEDVVDWVYEAEGDEAIAARATLALEAEQAKGDTADQSVLEELAGIVNA